MMMEIGRFCFIRWISMRRRSPGDEEEDAHSLGPSGTTIGSLLLFVHGLLIHSLSQFTSAALGAVTLVLAYGVLHLLGGIGMGDVKYAGVVGLYLGSLSWSALWWGTLVAFLLAASASVWPVSTGQRRSDRVMAFGPAMVVGALAGALISSRDG